MVTMVVEWLMRKLCESDRDLQEAGFFFFFFFFCCVCLDLKNRERERERERERYLIRDILRDFLTVFSTKNEWSMSTIRGPSA